MRQYFTLSKNKDLNNTSKNILKVLLLWCPVTTVLFVVGFGGHDKLLWRLSVSYVISAAVAFSCMFGSYFLEYLHHLYLKQRGLEPRKHGLFWGILTSYIFLVPGLYIGFEIAEKLSRTFDEKWNKPAFTDYTAGIIFGFFVSGLFLLFEVIRESKEAKQAAELKLQALENEKLKAQVSALTAQMNPHLLFNSLNTIASTIATDPKSAEDMVVQLSELYRGILHSAKGDVHTLESELLLCKSYLEIEQKRFGPRVEYKICVEPTIDPKKIKIPVLLLQPLVENAVKHGLSPKKDGGRVLIEVNQSDDRFIIAVKDNGVGIASTQMSKGTRTGLSNCESRIKLKYGNDSKFHFARNEQNETAAVIHLPMRAVAHD